MTWDNSLVGRSVLVTGGSRGLGREMGLFLAKAGVKLCFTATKKSEKFVKTLQEVTDILGHNNVFADIVDVCNPEAMERLAFLCEEKFSRIDVLINNAGRGMRLISEKFNTVPTKFWEADPKSWSKIVETNINGPFIATRAVLPYMLKQKFGKIINISSIIGEIGNKGQGNYAASKAGVVGLTKSLSKELGSRNINVNAINPGFIKTKMTENLDKDINLNFLNRIPLKRFGTAEDVSNLVYFLASNDSDYITGQTINIDGGMVV